MEGLSEKEKGLMDTDNKCVDCLGEGNIRELDGNGKKTIKIK